MQWGFRSFSYVVRYVWTFVHQDLIYCLDGFDVPLYPLQSVELCGRLVSQEQRCQSTDLQSYMEVPGPIDDLAPPSPELNRERPVVPFQEPVLHLEL